MSEINIVSKREVIERGSDKKVVKLPVFNLETGTPQDIYVRDTTAYDIPVEGIQSKILKSSLFQDLVIIDIREKLRNAEKRIKVCNMSTLDAICEVDKLAYIQSRYIHNLQPTAFDLLIEDINNLKKNFMCNCRHVPKGDIREEIEKDIKLTFHALDIPMDDKDRMELFGFYLSGIIKGYSSVFENMEIEFESPLIDNIMSLYERYEKEDISPYDTWKLIQGLLS